MRKIFFFSENFRQKLLNLELKTHTLEGNSEAKLKVRTPLISSVQNLQPTVAIM